MFVGWFCETILESVRDFQYNHVTSNFGIDCLLYPSPKQQLHSRSVKPWISLHVEAVYEGRVKLLFLSF